MQQIIGSDPTSVLTVVGVAEILINWCDSKVRLRRTMHSTSPSSGSRPRSSSVTADPHLLDLCHEEGIDVTVLADSSGRSWSPG